MGSVTTDRIRNVALVGHGGTGKTTLAEALLARAGAVGRPGRVEDGSTVSDSEPEEQRRRQSLSTSLLTFEWREHKINLLDTPGYADFEAEALVALRIADLAVFVVSAVECVPVVDHGEGLAACDHRHPLVPEVPPAFPDLALRWPRGVDAA